MKVKDAMHEGVEWMGPSASVVELANKMKQHDIGAIPIGENDKLIGMVTDRDLVIKGFTNGASVQDLTARDVMTEGIVYCSEDEELGDALQIMEDKQIRRLAVINEDKRMVGILSLGDVSHSASRQMAGELAASVSEHHAR